MKPSTATVFVLGNHVQACCWLVPRLPRAGESLQATGLTVEPGGKGLNVAVGLHRLGLDVRVMMGCGQDAAGDELLQVLHQEGINTDGVIRFPCPSGWGAGMIGADGQNAIAVYPGANLWLEPRHVQQHQAQIAQADCVYGQFETAIAAVAEAFTLAHAQGIDTVLNPSPWQTPPAALYLSTRVLLVNESEAQHLLDLPSPLPRQWPQAHSPIQSRLTSLWSQWPALEKLIITLGDQGVALYSRHSLDAQGCKGLYMPAFAIKVVDTVGAGDAFAAGLLSHWLSHQAADQTPIERWSQALHTGQLCGAHMAATQGVLGALPDRQLLQALSSQTPAVPAVQIRALN